MALLAYKADSIGFPEFYLTDVTTLVRVTGDQNGQTAKQPIRQPYLDKAAKILVPNGWFHQ